MNSFAILDPPIQTLHHSICFLKDNKVSSPIITSDGYSYYHLSGQHVADNTNRELISSRSVNSSMAFLFPRVRKKYPEDYGSFLLWDWVLGFTLNTETMTVVLPTTKMNSIQLDVGNYKVLHNKTICLKVLFELLDKLVATKPAVFRSPLHYQALQHLKISMMRSGQKVTTIPPESQKDLTWWHTQLPMLSCSPTVQKESSVVIDSDASLKGWGANCKGMRTSGVWNVNEAQCHIYFVELKAACLAIQCFLKERSGVSVLLWLHNCTAMGYLNHIGGIYDLSMLSSNWDMGVMSSTRDNNPCRIFA